MNEKNDGGPAFPYKHEAEFRGMSLRDWFAGRAMQGLVANGVKVKVSKGMEREVATAMVAYQIADAMIAEGNKQ